VPFLLLDHPIQSYRQEDAILAEFYEEIRDDFSLCMQRKSLKRLYFVSRFIVFYQSFARQLFGALQRDL